MPTSSRFNPCGTQKPKVVIADLRISGFNPVGTLKPIKRVFQTRIKVSFNPFRYAKTKSPTITGLALAFQSLVGTLKLVYVIHLIGSYYRFNPCSTLKTERRGKNVD